jgi:hypothetical protein
MMQSEGSWAFEGRAHGLNATDDTGSQVPVLADDFDELLVRLLPCAVSVDVDGQWISNTNGV